jgi:phosphatidylinositol 4-kinase
VITTLYTLGNVLSSGSSTERALAGGTNGDLSMDGKVNPTFYTGKQSTGSSISLAISGDEETSVVYGNVVQAICGIASCCNDAKITALAQSMLLQKIDKVNRSVDARIITEAAELSLNGGQLEFRSLLKLYAKISNDGVLQNNEVLMGAVSMKVLEALMIVTDSTRS